MGSRRCLPNGIRPAGRPSPTPGTTRPTITPPSRWSASVGTRPGLTAPGCPPRPAGSGGSPARPSGRPPPAARSPDATPGARRSIPPAATPSRLTCGAPPRWVSSPVGIFPGGYLPRWGHPGGDRRPRRKRLGVDGQPLSALCRCRRRRARGFRRGGWVPRGARRVLALRPGRRARGLPWLRRSWQPLRRPRVSGVVVVPHPLSAVALVTGHGCSVSLYRAPRGYGHFSTDRFCRSATRPSVSAPSRAGPSCRRSGRG